MMKQAGQRAVTFSGALLVILTAGLGGCTTTGQPQAVARSRPLVPMLRIEPLWKPPPKSTFCIWFSFTATPKGGVAHERVVAGLRNDKVDLSPYEQQAANTLAEDKFFPREVKGKPVATHNVVQAYLYVSTGKRATENTIAWACNQPILVTSHPIIVLSGPATAAKPTAASSSGNPPSKMMSTSFDRGAKAGQFAVRISHVPPHHPLGSADVPVTVRFCVDPRGHVADAELAGGDGHARAIALAAIEALPFTPRGSGAPANNARGLLIGMPGSSGVTYQPVLILSTITTGDFMGRSRRLHAVTPMWSCGLVTRVDVYPRPVNGVVAKIDRAWFNSLDAKPPKS